jgi:hypothetical protein
MLKPVEVAIIKGLLSQRRQYWNAEELAEESGWSADHVPEFEMSLQDLARSIPFIKSVVGLEATKSWLEGGRGWYYLDIKLLFELWQQNCRTVITVLPDRENLKTSVNIDKLRSGHDDESGYNYLTDLTAEDAIDLHDSEATEGGRVFWFGDHFFDDFDGSLGNLVAWLKGEPK